MALRAAALAGRRLFVGLPVLLALGFSLGVTGGLNSTVAAIGQDGTRPTASHPRAYRQLFADPRFVP